MNHSTTNRHWIKAWRKELKGNETSTHKLVQESREANSADNVQYMRPIGCRKIVVSDERGNRFVRTRVLEVPSGCKLVREV